MTLQVGARLGPYEIVAPIGAGGMGEVWRAKDTRLDREVAIKVLPEGFAAAEKLKARFEREAKAISQLNHPNVCTLFDVGQTGTTTPLHYIVMEYLEGESLANRLKRGALSLHEVVKYGQQIASALHAAHRRGITHRDLKPGNVVLTKSGAKLLDFGLAKTTAESPAEADVPTNVPTAAMPLTQEGTVLGTFQYMAPEQLDGLEADARTDIFALGAVLYEMATGQRAFPGSSRTSVIAAIATSQPAPISSVIALAPPALDHVVQRCLEKDPDDRWQSAHDVAGELLWISEAGSQAGAPVLPSRARERRRAMGWVAVGLLAITAALSGSGWYRAATVQPRRIAYDIALGDNHTVGDIQLSPDGRRLAFYDVDHDLGTWHIAVRSLDSRESRVLRGTEFANNYFCWSPDGEWIAFTKGAYLYKLSLAGGEPAKLSDTKLNPRGQMTWGSDGMIYLAPQAMTAIHAIPATGGDAVPVTTLDPETERSHRQVFVLPDGRLLFHVQMHEGVGADARNGIYIATPGREGKKFVARAGGLLYLAGHVVLPEPGNAKKGRLTRLDADDRLLIEEAVVVELPLEVAELSIAADGTIAAVERVAPTRSQLVWFDRQGNELGSVAPPANFSEPRISPDGLRVAVREYSSEADAGIWIYDIRRGTRSKLASGEDTITPRWNADGTRLVYVAGSRPSFRMESTRADGVGEARVLVEGQDSGEGRFNPLVVTDDDEVIYAEMGEERVLVKSIPLLGGDGGRTLWETSLSHSHMTVSPDGSMIAYVDFSIPPGQVYVQRLDENGQRVQVSPSGGSWPRWGSNGQELYFYSFAHQILVVELRTEAAQIVAGEAKPLFRVVPWSWNRFYDVSADDQRFLVSVLVGGIQEVPISMFHNWIPGGLEPQ